MPNDNASATQPPTNPSPPDKPVYLTAKAAGECLLGSLSEANKSEALYIFSLRDSIEKYNNSPEFGLLPKYIPIVDAVEYAGDADSVYALLEDVFEHDDEEKRFGRTAGISNADRDEIAIQLHTWSSQVFSEELKPQAQALGHVFHRDMLGGYLLTGGRLMCLGPSPQTTA